MGRPKRYCGIDDCGRDAVGDGMCGMHWQRWRKHGDPRVVLARWRQTPEERFWPQVDKTDGGCWLWTGKTKNGYGAFYVTIDGRNRLVQAHRFSYELAVGPIPEGMTLDHLCHTAVVDDCRSRGDCPHRSCINPDHLEPISLGDNVRRGGNGTKTHCKRGHEFTPENTYILKRGGRSCRICLRMHAAALRERRRQEAADSKAVLT